MPALKLGEMCSSPDIPNCYTSPAQLLYKHSINSLLGIQASGLRPQEGDSAGSPLSGLLPRLRQQRSMSPRVSIPASRASMMNEFPNSPMAGQTPRSLMPHFFPPKNVSCFGSYSEIGYSGLDKMIKPHRNTPDDNLRSSPSPAPRITPTIDNSITELMNCLSLMPPSNQQYQCQGSKLNGYDHHDRSESSSTEEIKCRWQGILPMRRYNISGVFSPKVFLGGLPWDITESTLIQAFNAFGQIRVEWPRKDQSAMQPKGYVYVIFESERQVRSLLESSNYDSAGNWFYRVSSRKMRSKEVQIIPWALDDSNYVKSSSVKLDPSRTVFVGALHGMLSAEGLANIMDDLFKGVVYAGIDTDKHKYPIGSGRVTFDNLESYMMAVSAAFVEIKTDKFYKKVQVDPYIEDAMCSLCEVQQGPYFCKEIECFRYFCLSCWRWKHAREEHKPLMRHSRTCSTSRLNGFSQGRSQSPTTSIASNGYNFINGVDNYPRRKRFMNNNNWNHRHIN